MGYLATCRSSILMIFMNYKRRLLDAQRNNKSKPYLKDHTIVSHWRSSLIQSFSMQQEDEVPRGHDCKVVRCGLSLHGSLLR